MRPYGRVLAGVLALFWGIVLWGGTGISETDYDYDGFIISPAASSGRIQTPTARFEEQWRLAVKNHISAPADTPEAKAQCFDKVLAGGWSNCLHDSHSHYTSRREVKMLEKDKTGKYEGIGLTLNHWRDRTFIVAVRDNSPAHRSGQFQAGDVIFEVNGEDVQFMPLDLIVEKVRGPEGTSVSIRVERDGRKMDPVSLVREKIIIELVTVKDMDDQITYIRMGEFTGHALAQFMGPILERRADVDVRADGTRIIFTRGFILDIRDNPGGFLEMVNLMSVAFARDPNNIIVTVGSREGEEIIRARDVATMSRINIPVGLFHGIRLVVLINGGSASASEIFAEFLRQDADAVLVGSRTYGKGSVQTIFPLKGGDAMRLTTAEYFVGNRKKKVNGVGVTPDVEVDPASPPKGVQAFIKKVGIDPTGDPELQKGIEVLRGMLALGTPPE